MDQIEKRLRETSENCFNFFEAWSKDKKNGEAREALLESIHELRRVASRLEIEVAVSERDENAQKPIPIPPHRDANRRAQGDDDAGNRLPDSGGGGRGNKSPNKRKRGPKKAS